MADLILAVDEAAQWLQTDWRMPCGLACSRQLRSVKTGRPQFVPFSVLVECLKSLEGAA